MDTWTHIVFVWNRETKVATLYQDGANVHRTTPLTGSDIDFVAPTSSEFDVGYKRDSQRVTKAGWFRELLVFDRAVTSEEVNIIRGNHPEARGVAMGARDNPVNTDDVTVP